MTFALAFWIIVLIVVVIGGIGVRQPGAAWVPVAWGWALLLLLLLLGWKVFGTPLHG